MHLMELACSPRFVQRRQQQRDQYGDDADDDQKLDERESST